MLWYGIFKRKELFGVEESEELAQDIATRMIKEDKAQGTISEYVVKPVQIMEVEVVHEHVIEHVAPRIERKQDPERFLDI